MKASIYDAASSGVVAFLLIRGQWFAAGWIFLGIFLSVWSKNHGE